MKKLIIFLTFSFLLCVFAACNQDPASVEEELELDEVVAEQAVFGWEVNKLISKSSEVEELTQNSQLLENEGIEGIYTVDDLKVQASYLFEETKKHKIALNTLHKPLSDSLYFFSDFNGVRTALYYNSATGIARYYVVKYKFPVWRKIQYDSSEVLVDAQNSLEDGSDDMLKSFFREQLFENNFFVQRIVSNLLVTDYVDKQITGVEVNTNSYYHANRLLQRLHQYIKINPNKSGTLSEEFEFRDGTHSMSSVTFYEDHHGEFLKELRDGTVITGTFESVDDDLAGSYTEIIDFPEGRYIDKIERSASVSITLPDSIFNADLSEAVFLKSGRIDSSHVMLQVQEISGIKTTKLDVQKANGAHGSFTITETETEGTVEGEWTTWNDYFITISASEYYFDGSAHLHYEVFSPPYNPGDDPIIVVDYYFSPDGTGNGTLSYEGKSYQITIDESTKAEISLEGKRTKINLF